jgi:tetratricopeptide (TPR) repeat protein
MSISVQSLPGSKPLRDARGRPYEPAIGPRLKVLLLLIFATFALLAATGGYLAVIRLLEWAAGRTYTNPFSFWIVILHIGVGVLLIAPFLAFGLTHLVTARHRPNRRAVKLGMLVFASGIIVCLTGLALIQLDGMPQLPTHSASRWVVYALHVLAPLAAVVLYVLHRRAGPDIQWRWGAAWGGVMTVFVAFVSVLHFCKLPMDVLVWHSWRYHLVFGLRVLAVEAVLVLGVLLLRRRGGLLPTLLLLAGLGLSWVLPGHNPLLPLVVLVPLAAVALYGLWRRWPAGLGAGIGLNLFLVMLWGVALGAPHEEAVVGSSEGEKYFEPSKARTADAKFIDQNELMMDSYCLQCHQDIYNDHYHSAHHFSSFNNPPYRFSVRESRKIVDEAGKPRASRWCAGCHDPVPFFSGKFDDPNYDDVNDSTAHAGITCVVCHAIERVNSTMGNADYTIRKPEHYPFARSDSPVLRWFSNQILKARPEFHKQTFLKPFHRDAHLGSEFCSTCHKVSLPVELNHYKEFLRGQDHYNSFLLSGVSGHSARSFYYPKKGEANCNGCHMPLKPSEDFGSRDFDGSGQRKVHNHHFPGGNTGLPWLLSQEPRRAGQAGELRAASEFQADFLRDKKLRIDLFALKEGGTVKGKLLGPIRPELPALEPGRTYLVEVVVRTLAIGHPFTQGTVDSNEVWVDFEARSGERIIGRNGALANPDDSGPLDEWAHRINVLLLDRKGHRINRRNPEDIFTPLYNHQIPPGAGQVVHYELEVPSDVKVPVELRVRVRYRKFDFEYMSLVYGGADKAPKLPVIDLCEDRVTLPVRGVAEQVPVQESPIKAAWQRWNDYGIGCLLEGSLRQAEKAFGKVAGLGGEAKPHGHVNRARVYIREGRYAEAVRDLNEASKANPPAPWTVAWLSGQVSVKNARTRKDWDNAIAIFESVVDPQRQPRDRGFDFSLDYVVINELARALFDRSQLEGDDEARRDPFLLRAIEQYNRTLALDPEDLDAHFGLHQCYQTLARAMPDYDGPLDAGTDEETLLQLSATLRNPQAGQSERLAAAAKLAHSLAELNREPVRVSQPKRLRLDKLLAQLPAYFQQEQDHDLRAAAAHVLDQLHHDMHEILRPDDLAQAVQQKYRDSHPITNRVANERFNYPTTPQGRARRLSPSPRSAQGR